MKTAAARRMVRLHYVWLLLISWPALQFISNSEKSVPNQMEWLPAVHWLALAGSTAIEVLQCIALLFFVSVALCIIRPQRRWPRLLIAVLWWQLLSAKYSLGKADHNFFAPLLATFLLTFVNLEQFNSLRSQVWNRSIVFYIQLGLLIPYSISGYWKALSVIQELFGGSLTGVRPLSLFFSAAEWANRYAPASELRTFLNDAAPATQMAMWLAIILFEVCATSLVFFQKWLPLYGAVLIFFHLIIYYLTGIDFLYATGTFAIFLIYVPLVARYHKTRT